MHLDDLVTLEPHMAFRQNTYLLWVLLLWLLSQVAILPHITSKPLNYNEFVIGIKKQEFWVQLSLCVLSLARILASFLNSHITRLIARSLLKLTLNDEDDYREKKVFMRNSHYFLTHVLYFLLCWITRHHESGLHKHRQTAKVIPPFTIIDKQPAASSISL